MGKYDRTKDAGALEKAINLLENALPQTTPRDPSRGKILLKLANMYHTRFSSTKAIADLDTSSWWSEEALRESEGLLVEQTLCLYQLSTNYLDKYQNSEKKDVADLDMAIRRGEEALSITPDDYVLRANYLSSISRAYGLRFFAAHSWEDWKEAVAKAQKALDHAPSPMVDRLRPFPGLYLLYSGAGEWIPTYEAACTAVTLISRLTPRFLQNSDKQHLLAEVCAGLASQAATAALETRKSPFDAIKLLELGRGVIFNSLHEMRTNISNIRQKRPKLAEKYIEYRDKLDAPTPLMETEFSERYMTDQKLEQVIQEIRKVQGFDQFLSPLSEEDMISASAPGPIVIINVEHHRCDAFIIQNKRLKTLPLPLLRRSDVEVLGQDLRTSVDPELLEWLWESIAEPVLDEIGFRETPSDGCWPRIWWIPTGPLAKFPIHAAGRHTDGSSNTVLDRAISSYSSSARALIYNRRSQPKVGEEPALGQRKAILVSMQETPGQRSLEFASQEIEELKTLCSSMKLDVCVPEPTRESILPILRDCEIFHFAGHGRAHPLDPAKSALILQDRPLSVEDLLQANTSSHSVPFLAYLSACGTGQIKHEALVDEGLHLISACQLAGFQHVIGTLWEVRDKSCIDAATRTYKWMEDQEVSDESVSEGLHHAVRSLRDAWLVENTATGAIRRYATRSESTARGANRVDIVPNRLRRTMEGEPRNVESVEDETFTPLSWCPYVHFGI
ncbi:uncharacterized protein N0V89_012364 [Didymosphaeria variabile]|uniref:CHAT domain-containing protein n=1 Tax=Didymosphaeria variabile TaxID=1932322 RepID=A0A9W8XAH2_9PLEO|nr:uncharacterized protein N0V89_012364 [Didymosphaeria variabile]KAJ4344620.1 hypothetical protein N0V89_012364 [Didymosphaeria variabile]